MSVPAFDKALAVSIMRRIAFERAAGTPDHPFLLWTQAEAAELRKRIETDDLAKKQYERMTLMESRKLGEIFPKATPNAAMLNLFKFAVLGDQAAGEAEKRALLGFIGRKPAQNSPGDPAKSNAAWRDDRTLDAWRYDVLYETLSAEQREGVERTIREIQELRREAASSIVIPRGMPPGGLGGPGLGGPGGPRGKIQLP